MLDTNRIIPARPAIVVNGEPDEELADSMLSLQIIENINGLYRCEAVFGNWGVNNNSVDYLYFDRRLLDFGVSFQVKLGKDESVIFDGRIMALEGQFPEGSPPTIAVLAEDRLQDLRMTRRTRTFSGPVSDETVIRKIASEHGLTAQVTLQGSEHDLLVQFNQSDLAFLRERARAIDAEIWVEDKTLHASSHTSRAGQFALDMTYGENLREISVLADLAGQRTSVSASGWDVKTKTAITSEATSTDIASETGSDQSGISILSSAFGQRRESLAHTVPLSNDEAKYVAQAYLKMSARRFVVGHGVADSNSMLRVGNTITLRGLGPLFNGKYYLSEVQHLFDDVSGMRTEFTAERPGLGRG